MKLFLRLLSKVFYLKPKNQIRSNYLKPISKSFHETNSKRFKENEEINQKIEDVSLNTQVYLFIFFT
jgi:hypothetical protein